MYYVLKKDTEETVAMTYNPVFASEIAAKIGFECVIRYVKGNH